MQMAWLDYDETDIIYDPIDKIKLDDVSIEQEQNICGEKVRTEEACRTRGTVMA